MLSNFLNSKIESQRLKKEWYFSCDYENLLSCVSEFKKVSPDYYYNGWRPTMKIHREDTSRKLTDYLNGTGDGFSEFLDWYFAPPKYLYSIEVGIEKLKKKVESKDEISDALHVSIIGYEYVEAGENP